ncbi:hypothetical protein [Microcoleus sp. K1-B6]|uniref:hypothetical protein n=1 Tax=Microcoleus sp. K1-B6 TaxID=2818787 RepID=UPI002FD82632
MPVPQENLSFVEQAGKPVHKRLIENGAISQLYRFRLHRNDLTAEGAENAEGGNTEMNSSDATGNDIITYFSLLVYPPPHQ